MQLLTREPEKAAVQSELAADVVLVTAVVTAALAFVIAIFFSIAELLTFGSTSRVYGEAFEDHRTEFEAAADWAAAHGDCVGQYVDLPDDLDYLAPGGLVSCGPRGVFVPQWSRMDASGGYWRFAFGSPEGYDMGGRICREPVALGDGWWSCGMPEKL